MFFDNFSKNKNCEKKKKKCTKKWLYLQHKSTYGNIKWLFLHRVLPISATIVVVSVIERVAEMIVNTHTFDSDFFNSSY